MMIFILNEKMIFRDYYERAIFKKLDIQKRSPEAKRTYVFEDFLLETTSDTREKLTAGKK